MNGRELFASIKLSSQTLGSQRSVSHKSDLNDINTDEHVSGSNDSNRNASLVKSSEAADDNTSGGGASYAKLLASRHSTDSREKRSSQFKGKTLLLEDIDEDQVALKQEQHEALAQPAKRASVQVRTKQSSAMIFQNLMEDQRSQDLIHRLQNGPSFVSSEDLTSAKDNIAIGEGHNSLEPDSEAAGMTAQT